jgi:hypothetical protein
MNGWNIYLNKDIVKKYRIPFYGIIVSYEQNLNSSIETLLDFIIKQYKVEKEDTLIIRTSYKLQNIDDNDITIKNGDN